MKGGFGSEAAFIVVEEESWPRSGQLNLARLFKAGVGRIKAGVGRKNRMWGVASATLEWSSTTSLRDEDDRYLPKPGVETPG